MLYALNVRDLNKKISRLYQDYFLINNPKDKVLLKRESYNLILYHPIYNIWLKNKDIDIFVIAGLINIWISSEVISLAPDDNESMLISKSLVFKGEEQLRDVNGELIIIDSKINNLINEQFLSIFSKVMLALENKSPILEKPDDDWDNKKFLEYKEQLKSKHFTKPKEIFESDIINKAAKHSDLPEILESDILRSRGKQPHLPDCFGKEHSKNKKCQICFTEYECVEIIETKPKNTSLLGIVKAIEMTRTKISPTQEIPSFLEKIYNPPSNTEYYKKDTPFSTCNYEDGSEYAANIISSDKRLVVSNLFVSAGLIGKWFNTKTKEIWLNLPTEWEEGLFKISSYGKNSPKVTLPLKVYSKNYNIEISPQEVNVIFIHKYGKDWLIVSLKKRPHTQHNLIQRVLKNQKGVLNSQRKERRAQEKVVLARLRALKDPAGSLSKFIKELAKIEKMNTSEYSNMLLLDGLQQRIKILNGVCIYSTSCTNNQFDYQNIILSEMVVLNCPPSKKIKWTDNGVQFIDNE
jgi:hypothetical protein